MPWVTSRSMVLAEEGKLRLSDAVEKWLPEPSDRKVLSRIDAPLDEMVPAHRPITVRDLLTFTMGFGLLFEEFAQISGPRTGPGERFLSLQ